MTMSRSEVWCLYGLLYVLFGCIVVTVALAVDGHEEKFPPRLFVGMAVFWPLTLAVVLLRSSVAVLEWGFGRKEK